MRTILLALVCLFPSFLASAQNNPHTLLWEVSKPGISDTSYLFGTFHEIYPDFFLSLSNAVQKLEQADLLFVEETIADREAYAEEGQSPDTWSAERWDSLLNEEQKQTFEAFIQKSESPEYYQLPPSALTLLLNRMYIWYFCDTLNRESYEEMDLSIEKYALERKKKVQSLDENQENILRASSSDNRLIEDSLFIAVCTNIMTNMLNDVSDCELVDKYKSLNIDYQLEQDKHNHPFQLTERNNKWVPVLGEAFRENRCFVAVGFRHLQYKQGLIQQLRDLGYLVQPVSVR